MTPCNLIWYVCEPYREAIRRAVKLANEHDQLVTVIDAQSGRAITRVPPRTGFYEVRRWK